MLKSEIYPPIPLVPMQNAHIEEKCSTGQMKCIYWTILKLTGTITLFMADFRQHSLQFSFFVATFFCIIKSYCKTEAKLQAEVERALLLVAEWLER